MTVCIPSQPVSLSAACLLHKSRDQYLPRLHRVTRGAHTLGTSMLCLLGCVSRGCISLIWRTICLVPVRSISSIRQVYTTDFAYDGPFFLVPLSLSYPSSPVQGLPRWPCGLRGCHWLLAVSLWSLILSASTNALLGKQISRETQSSSW